MFLIISRSVLPAMRNVTDTSFGENQKTPYVFNKKYSSTVPWPQHWKGVNSQQHAPAALYPRERPGTHFTGGWVDPRAGMDGRKISSPPGFDRRIFHPVTSPYTDWAIPAQQTKEREDEKCKESTQFFLICNALLSFSNLPRDWWTNPATYIFYPAEGGNGFFSDTGK